MSFSLFLLTQAMGWTLTHMVWQATVVTLAAALGLGLLRNGSARARYTLLIAAMAVLAGAAVSTFLAHYQRPLGTLGGALVDADPSALTYALTQRAVQTSAGLDLVQFLNAYMTPAVVVWSLCVLVLLIRLAGGMVVVQKLKRLDLTPVPAQLQARFQELYQQMGLTKTPRLYQSARAAVPMAVGYFRPVVLLPLGALTHLPADQLEAVLRHELAHIKRADCLVNLFQTLMETLFFYHPAVWWLSNRIREEREHCCDDMALHHQTSPLTLARALTNLQEVTMQSQHLAMTAVRKGGLRARVQRLVAKPRLKPSFFETAFIGVAILVMSSAVLTRAAAPQAEENPKPMEQPPQSPKATPGLVWVDLPGQEEPPAPPAHPEPVSEPTPVVDPGPVFEPTPAVRPKPVSEPTPVVRPKPVVEPKPAVDPGPVSEPTPATPAIDRAEVRAARAAERSVAEAARVADLEQRVQAEQERAVHERARLEEHQRQAEMRVREAEHQRDHMAERGRAEVVAEQARVSAWAAMVNQEAAQAAEAKAVKAELEAQAEEMEVVKQRLNAARERATEADIALKQQHERLTEAQARLNRDQRRLEASSGAMARVIEVLTRELEADGLIGQGDSFELELNTTGDHPGFYLNGQKQSEDRFQKYLEIYGRYVDVSEEGGVRARIVQ